MTHASSDGARVAFVAPDIPDYGIHFARMAQEVCDARLFIAAHRLAPERVEASDRLDVRRLDWPRQRQVGRSLAFVAKLAREIRAFKPDLVHFLADGNVWMGPLALLLGPRVPRITTIHDVDYHPGDSSSRQAPRAALDVLLRNSEALIVHGDALREAALRRTVLARKSIHVFPHLPLDLYKRLADANGWRRPADGRLRILFFGRMYAYKGLSHLLAAAHQVHSARPETTFVLAGAGPDWEGNRKAAEAPYIEVIDRFVPTLEAARLFAEADILALPYIEASQSGVLMMALPFGLACVCSNVGEMAVTVAETGAGVLVPPGDQNALAEALISLASDAALRERVAAKAAAAAAGPLSKQALAARLHELYEHVLSSNPARPTREG